MKTLAIVNSNAASGQAVRQFEAIRPLLQPLFDSLDVAITAHPSELAGHLARAADQGLDTVLALGGDGTNLAVVNALHERGSHPFTFASLPFGTGQDWARALGIPRVPAEAVKWLAAAHPRRVDLGRVTSRGTSRLFVNVASAGVSGEIARRTEVPHKRPWTFLQATVGTLLQFDPPQMRVFLDGEPWYEGDAYVLAVGNGRFFGRGMKVCPDALIDDGLFDVVLAEGTGRLQALALLPTLFSGSHVQRPDVRVRRARHVRVEPMEPTLGMEMDGEPNQGATIAFEVLPQALPMLLGPSAKEVLAS